MSACTAERPVCERRHTRLNWYRVLRISSVSPVQLTKFTDVGLRILMRVTVPSTDRTSLTTQSVAAQLAVSPAHAAKVVSRLQTLGLVETRRGRNGGLTVTDAGRHASVGWVARQLEGNDEVIDCESGIPCPLRDACRLRSLLRQAQEAFFATLDPYTVEELTHSPTGSVLLTLGSRPQH